MWPFVKKTDLAEIVRDELKDLREWRDELCGAVKAAIEESDDDVLKMVREAGDIVQLQSQKVDLQEQVGNLSRKLDDLRADMARERMDLEHAVRLKEERLQVKMDHREVELEKAFQKKEAELRREHHEALMATVKEGKDDLQKIHREILARLPNVTATFKRSEKGGGD